MSNVFNPWQNQLLHQQQKLQRQQMLRMESLRHSTNAMNMKQNIQMSIRRKRLALGVSEEDLATATGLSRFEISHIEHGLSDNFENILKVISALQLNIQLY